MEKQMEERKENLRDERKEKREMRGLKIVFFGQISASLGGFALGISLGWNSKASVVLRNYFDATVTEIGLIGGILNGGICIGAISMMFIAGRVSRTKIMFWTMPVLLLTWILMISHRGQKVSVRWSHFKSAIKLPLLHMILY